MPLDASTADRSPIAAAPPMVVATAPLVVVSAFAPTSVGRSTTCGSDAESDDSTNRLTDTTTSALA